MFKSPKPAPRNPVAEQASSLYETYDALIKKQDAIIEKYTKAHHHKAYSDPAISGAMNKELGDLPTKITAAQKALDNFVKEHHLHPMSSPSGPAQFKK